jgi:DNA-binding NarL/FixJ family response regulator
VAHPRYTVGLARISPDMVEAVRDTLGSTAQLIDAAADRAGSPRAFDLILVGAGTDWRHTQRFLTAECPVVMLAHAREEDQEYAAIAHGAAGYVTVAPVATLRRALRAALAGEAVFQRGVFGRWLRAQQRQSTSIARAPLTPRQQQILLMIAEGATNKEIAATLRLKRSTVEKHVSNLLKRLGARNRAAAVGLQDPPDGRRRVRAG